MSLTDDVLSHLRMAARIADFCGHRSDQVDEGCRLEELESDAVEALLLDPDCDVSEHARDIAAILAAGQSA